MRVWFFSRDEIKGDTENFLLKDLWVSGIQNYKFIIISAFENQCSFSPDIKIKLLKDSELEFISWIDIKDKKGQDFEECWQEEIYKWFII